MNSGYLGLLEIALERTFAGFPESYTNEFEVGVLSSENHGECILGGSFSKLINWIFNIFLFSFNEVVEVRTVVTYIVA